MIATNQKTRFLGLVPYAFVAAPLIYLGVFMFWPLMRQILTSFTDTRLTRPTEGAYIGLQNYVTLLNDPQFYTTLRVTIVYTLATVLLGVTLGVISALAIDRPFRGRSLVRAILLFGWAVPNVAAVLIWLWMFNGPSGVLNDVALAMGLDRIEWLTSVQMAFPSLLVVTVWQVTPFVMLVILAALQSVPGEVREAARIDGAEPFLRAAAEYPDGLRGRAGGALSDARCARRADGCFGNDRTGCRIGRARHEMRGGARWRRLGG